MKYKNQGDQVRSHELVGVWIHEPNIMFTECVDPSISKGEKVFKHHFDGADSPTYFFDIKYVANKLKTTPENLIKGIYNNKITVQTNLAVKKTPSLNTVEYKFTFEGNFIVFKIDEAPDIHRN